MTVFVRRRGTAVAALEHLHVMVRDSRERIAVTDRRREQHRDGDEHREQRSDVHKSQKRSHQPLRSTSSLVIRSNG